MNIPTLPNLAAGQVVHAADLNNIAAACTFLLGKPISRVHDATGGTAIGTSSYVAAQFPVKDIDTDGMWSSGNAGRLTIQTPGWYKARYSIQISGTGGAGIVFNGRIKKTNGPANPAGAGVTNYLPSYGNESSTGMTTYCGAAGLVPVYLYAGDFLNATIIASATGSTTGIDAGMPNSYFSAELVGV